MATLTKLTPELVAEELAFTAAASGGDQFVNTGKEMVFLANASGVPITVTIASQRDCDQGFTHDITAAVAAGETWVVGPFSQLRFSDSNGYVQMTYSTEVDLSVAVVTGA